MDDLQSIIIVSFRLSHYMHECFSPLSNTEHEVERSCINTFCLVPGSPAGNMAAYGNGRGACRTLRGLAGHNLPLAFQNIINTCFIGYEG